MTDTTMPAATSQAPTNFLVQYTKQRKLTRIFIATTLIAVVAFTNVLTMYITDPKTKTAASKRGAFQFGQGGGRGNFTPGQGGGGQRLGMNVKTLFKSDGSVDTSKVTALTKNIPASFKDQFLTRFGTQIDTAVTNKDITSAQATALKTALGIK